MITIRRSEERGRSSLGWLDSRHTFSFGDYYDPDQMGFRTLRVINDDRVIAGQGFGRHGHRDMEIISIVYAGKLLHRDSLGHGQTLRPGDVQVMTAGHGMMHEEYNGSETEPVHFLQLWILPQARGLEPAYAQKPFPIPQRLNRWQQVAGPADSTIAEPLTIHQNATVWLSRLEKDQEITHRFLKDRAGWLQVVDGEITSGGKHLKTGDGAAIDREAEIVVRGASASADLILFDLI
ncbi:MAG: Quercetin 2,3-dioxygenase [Phycisphaerae bacterium]|nr:Quercetin 2,3-dioxygenase [Phycisphaerae bacterium]